MIFLKKIFSSLNGQAKTITSAAIIIGLATFASKILGLVRDRVLAGTFGAGRTLDIYYASFRIPDLVFNLIVLGILSAGFIPVFTEYLQKDKKEAWRLVNNVLSVLFLCLVVISVIGILLLPKFMRYLAPGFNESELLVTVEVTKIMFLSPILLGIAGIFSGVLQSFKRFVMFSLAPIFYNLGIIVGAIFFTPYFWIYGLAWGVVLGAALHLAIQFPSVLAMGYRPQWILSLSGKGLRKIFSMMIPRTLGLAVSQLNLVVVTVLGSILQEGSLSVFNFANNIQSVPLMLFGISYAIAVFPTLSESASDKNEFIRNLSLTFRQILFFIIPASAILILLRAQIVRVVLGSGEFDWTDTILTMNTLAIFSVSLFAQSLSHLFLRAFFALQDSITPFCAGLVSAVINIVLSMYFIFGVKNAGVEELALAFSISSVVNLLILWIVLKVKLGGFDEHAIFLSTIKIATGAFCMALAVQGVKYAIEPLFGTNTLLGISLQGAVSSIIGIFVYFTVCFSLKSPEAALFVSSFHRRFLRKYVPSEHAEQG